MWVITDSHVDISRFQWCACMATLPLPFWRLWSKKINFGKGWWVQSDFKIRPKLLYDHSNAFCCSLPKYAPQFSHKYALQIGPIFFVRFAFVISNMRQAQLPTKALVFLGLSSHKGEMLEGQQRKGVISSEIWDAELLCTDPSSVRTD